MQQEKEEARERTTRHERGAGSEVAACDLPPVRRGKRATRRSSSDSEKPMWSIGAHETVANATARMLDARVGSLMVTTDPNGGEAVGILTERE